MIFLGDYIAIGLVIVLSLFYFERRTNWRYMSTDNRYFVACLFLTALTALIDLLTGWLLTVPTAPLWLELAANTAYFLVNIITTSFFALFLFTKILEHAIDSHCMTYARRGLAILFSLYLILVCSNFWTGILFYFDEQGNYCRGPFNAAGYIVTLLQMCLVMMCYLRNKKNANKPMRRVLAQTFPVIVLCIIIQRSFPEVMLNTFVMAMVALVLFLSFQGQRQGVHSLTELNDRHRFFKEIEQRIMHKSPFRVFLINIKNFGTINQKYGHLFGDELLYQFAFALERLFKESISFHMNGTVFALVLPAAVQTLAEEQCGTLLGFLEEKVACRNRQVTLDYILVEYTADGTEVSAAEFYEKLEYAAAKAYQDKHKYTRYEPEMGAKMERDRYLLERLQTVDRAAGYEVWYQPVQCLATGRFCSMEALIRLREQDGSLVSPAEFIPLAEETGRISSVTWFVLEEVCHLLATTPELRDISVSVNMPMPRKSPFLSMTDLYHTPGTADAAAEALAGQPEAQALFQAEIDYARGDIDAVYEKAQYFLSKHSGPYAIIAAGMLPDMLADKNIQGELLIEIYSDLALLQELHDEFCQCDRQEDLPMIYESILQERDEIYEKITRYRSADNGR